MAPYSVGILETIFALGAGIEGVLAEVGDYHFGITFNSSPLDNQDAYALPRSPDTDRCTELGALIRGQDECAATFEGRAYITAADELGAGLSCLAGPLTSVSLAYPHEEQRTLDTLVAVLESALRPALAVCNEGFHAAGDPLIVVIIVDDVDLSTTSVIEAVGDSIASQGTSLRNVGVLLIGADPSSCTDGGGTGGTTEGSSSTGSEPACEAVPSCRVHDFIRSGFPGSLIDDNVRQSNICRTLEDDTAAVAAEVEQHLVELIATVCEA